MGEFDSKYRFLIVRPNQMFILSNTVANLKLSNVSPETLREGALKVCLFSIKAIKFLKVDLKLVCSESANDIGTLYWKGTENSVFNDSYLSMIFYLILLSHEN